MPHPPPALIALPGGLAVSGVALFAARLSRALAERGGRVTLALHAPPAGHAPLDIELHPDVRVLDLSRHPPIEVARGDRGPYLDAYGGAVRDLASSGRDAHGPVSLILGQHAGPFGIAAALSGSDAGLVRCVGVAHSDNGYDTRVLEHYEPVLHRMVAVSDTLQGRLRAAMPARGSHIANIPYGIPVPPAPASRPPAGGRPLRLLYAGRIEHRQKRIMALPALARELTERGIDHTLTIVGAGPAMNDLAEACRGLPSVTILEPATPDRLEAMLDEHDAFVLPSRFEGLSIAMLEALSRGCVPVVAPSDSGTAQAIDPGRTGEIAAATPDDDEQATALALADAIDALRRRDTAEMSRRCHALARDRFSIGSHTDAWVALLRSLRDDAPRVWDASRPVAFDAPSASGSVPPDASDRMARVLASLSGEPVCIHGAGAHTLAVAGALRDANVVAITDDDRQRFGARCLDWTVSDPATAAGTGARHVVISSHLHESAIWNRRAVYESQGLSVHRLYEDPAS